MAHEGGMTALLKNVARGKGMSPAQFEIAGILSREDADLNLPIYSGRDVFEWIKEGDPVTCEIYREWIAALVHVIYSLKMIMDPEKIVIGGGVSRNPRLLKDIKAEYEKTKSRTAASDLLKVEIDVCRFSAAANLIGAVHNWLQHYESGRKD
jgi:predicted NBD/HSP70 family sugar kinase